ncbi:MAG: hypothetical protein JWM68_1480 [Verrucomicrobiales bacterium]|nr:hypothetical protein [Verrucomicrobiales bacterium]
MEYVSIGLMAIGGIVILVGTIMFLIAAFSESILWGLGSIFVPFVALVFLCMHWDVAKRPFLIKLAGLAVVAVGVVLMMMMTHSTKISP